MQTKVHEIADGIYRLSTHVSNIAPPAGFTFNQFLVAADEPLLFHCGLNGIFPSVREAVESVLPVRSLRWISFGHIEADECGSMNRWLEAAPEARVAHGATATMVSINDLAIRGGRVLKDGEAMDLGGKRVRYLDTPHVPHAWESGLLYEENTRTLFCGDLFTHLGDGPPVTGEEILSPAVEAEKQFRSTNLCPAVGPTIRRLARLTPVTLAVMHGSSFSGDAEAALTELAGFYEEETAAVLERAA
jgi:flavorubredoxin